MSLGQECWSGHEGLAITGWVHAVLVLCTTTGNISGAKK